MFQPIFHSFTFLFLAAAALLAVTWQTAPRKNGKRMWKFILLRWMFLLIFTWVLARPTFSVFETETYPGSVLILTDSSRSMQVKDGAETRFQSMKDALRLSSKALAEMMKNVETQAWSFDRTLVPVEIQSGGKLNLPAEAEGEESALGAALQDVLKKSTGRKILGIVLLSDGAQRAIPPRDALPQAAAANLQRLGIPLFTLCFGSEQQKNRTRDAAVEDFLVEQRVFVETETVVSGKIRLDGLENLEVPVELLVENAHGEMNVAARTTVRAGSASESIPVQLSWVPKEIGEVKVSLRVPALDDEISTANNQLDAFVSVVKSGLRVLYVEGAYRPESGFLRRSLDSAEEIQLEMIRVHAPTPNSSETFNLQPTLSEDFAVLILGDVSASCFPPEDWRRIAQKVEGGMGLLTLGGLGNYGPGGYGETALAQVLPVEMSANERPNSTENPQTNQSTQTPQSTQTIQTAVTALTVPADPTSAAQWNLPLRMKPTPAGRRHLALALDSDAAYSAQLWEKLPPLDGANRFQSLKPGAVVLASDFTPEKTEVPLLIEHSFGRGRVMMFPADSTWRWQLGGFEDVHKRFWRQLVFWLANKDAALDGSVALILPQRRFTQEQPISFQVSARLSNGEIPLPPLHNTQMESWTAFLKTADGKEIPVALVPDRETMRGKISEELPPGDYTLQASVTHQGQKIGDAQCRFQVYHHDLELDNAQAEPELLASLASSTGGAAVRPDALSTLWRQLAENREELKIERETVVPIWDRWTWLLLLLALLCSEWFLRKYQGLV